MGYLIKWKNIPREEYTREYEQFKKENPQIQALTEIIF